MVLYAVWILPEIVGFRNTALAVGAVASLYPIYLHRSLLLQKGAMPVWLILSLFFWATFHLIYLSQDYAVQLLEYKRIWKYAAIGAIFAFGLGISLASSSKAGSHSLNMRCPYWSLIYFGLCLPVTIYVLKYCLATYGAALGIEMPPYLLIYHESQRYYVPKTDYVAFCLPALAIAFGQIYTLLISQSNLKIRQYQALFFYAAIIAATFFLFYKQNIKNGMAYAAICMGSFTILFLVNGLKGRFWRKLLFILIGMVFLNSAFYLHVQKNDSWKTLIADTKVAFQLDNHQEWKYAGAQGYPINEYGKIVSVTNYERAAWFKVGSLLALNEPLGYGLIEDSFKRMVKSRWPEASDKLSHSHSGWLDLVLAVGFPGFACLIGAMIWSIWRSRCILQPWRDLVFWGLCANFALWITTEVSATVTFCALVFWTSLSIGLIFGVSPRAKAENSSSLKLA